MSNLYDVEARKRLAQYLTVENIGSGNFGTVDLVECDEDSRLYVKKRVRLGGLKAKERQVAQQEAALLGKLSHACIVGYREALLVDEELHIVMEYCDGGDLSEMIESTEGEHFPEALILDWFTQLALGLRHVHNQNILHRDLKTQNVFLTGWFDERGEPIDDIEFPPYVKLGDFGIAKVLSSDTDFAKTAIGTPFYLSPEICEGRSYNKKSDIWSLGCILYELATLKHAFDGRNLPSLVMKILRGSYPPIPQQYSQELSDLVNSMLQQDPKKRPTINAICKLPFIAERAKQFRKRVRVAQLAAHQHGSHYVGDEDEDLGMAYEDEEYAIAEGDEDDYYSDEGGDYERGEMERVFERYMSSEDDFEEEEVEPRRRTPAPKPTRTKTPERKRRSRPSSRDQQRQRPEDLDKTVPRIEVVQKRGKPKARKPKPVSRSKSRAAEQGASPDMETTFDRWYGDVEKQLDNNLNELAEEPPKRRGKQRRSRGGSGGGKRKVAAAPSRQGPTLRRVTTPASKTQVRRHVNRSGAKKTPDAEAPTRQELAKAQRASKSTPSGRKSTPSGRKSTPSSRKSTPASSRSSSASSRRGRGASSAKRSRGRGSKRSSRGRGGKSRSDRAGLKKSRHVDVRERRLDGTAKINHAAPRTDNVGPATQAKLSADDRARRRQYMEERRKRKEEQQKAVRGRMASHKKGLKKVKSRFSRANVNPAFFGGAAAAPAAADDVVVVAAPAKPAEQQAAPEVQRAKSGMSFEVDMTKPPPKKPRAKRPKAAKQPKQSKPPTPPPFEPEERPTRAPMPSVRDFIKMQRKKKKQQGHGDELIIDIAVPDREQQSSQMVEEAATELLAQTRQLEEDVEDDGGDNDVAVEIYVAGVRRKASFRRFVDEEDIARIENDYDPDDDFELEEDDEDDAESTGDMDRTARLSSEIENLRRMCEDELGGDRFREVYTLLRDSDDDDENTEAALARVLNDDERFIAGHVMKILHLERLCYG